jgi:hypothetical protein
MPEKEPEKERAISRRDFLKYSLAGALAVAWALSDVKKIATFGNTQATSTPEGPTGTPDYPTDAPEDLVENSTPTPEVTPEITPAVEPKEVLLSSVSLSLKDRNNNSLVNEVAKRNILLCLAYMNGSVNKAGEINWNVVESPFQGSFTLQPKEVFAFHDQVLPQFAPVAVTTKSNFSFEQGYQYDGHYYGAGVCDLASLICWAAKTAGLDKTYAPTKHTKPIPGVPKEYAVAIYYDLGNPYQNLYIPNSLDNPVVFNFNYDGETLTVDIVKKNQNLPNSPQEVSKSE